MTVNQIALANALNAQRQRSIVQAQPVQNLGDEPAPIPESKLVRTKNTATVHVRGCSRSGPNPLPWLFAEGKTLAEIREELDKTYVPAQCKSCRPLAVETWEAKGWPVH